MQGRAVRFAGVLGLALCLAGPVQTQTQAQAQAQTQAQTRSALSADGGALTLHAGERVVVRLGADGALRMLSATAADPAEALPPRAGSRPADAPLQGADPGTVALLLGGAADQVVLKLESGLSQAFDYRATLRRDDVEQPASVCTVLPLLAAYEVWPYAVATVTLSGFATRPTNAVACADPP